MAQKKSWLVFVFVLFILFCYYPYEFYSTYLLPLIPDQSNYLTAVMVIVAGIVLLFRKKHNKIPLSIIFVAVVQMMGFIMVAFVHDGLGSVKGSFLRIALAILLVCIIDGSEDGLEGFYKKYNKWILLMAILGTVTWALATFAGFQPIAPFIERSGGATMYNYGFTFTKSDFNNIGMIRYAGFFDEPGAMAYWGIYALIINKMFIKDNKLELFLIICLLFTFSLGFYFQLLVYLLLFSTGEKGKRTWGVIIALAILVFIVLLRVSPDSVVYAKSIGRISAALAESQESGSIFAIGNRAEYAENAKQLFLNNPLFGASTENLGIGNNLYENLASYGVFGCLFILFPYFYLTYISLKHKDSVLLKSSIILLLGFTHRPFHGALLNYFVMYSIILMFMNGRVHEHFQSSVKSTV